LLESGTVKKDHAEALSWLRKSAQQADSEAQDLIGDIYASGASVEKDYPQAIAWYRKAVDSSSSKFAHGRLGRMYEEGLGVPQNRTQALQLYGKAADGTIDVPLHLKLARTYEEGIGTAKDGSKAVQHYGSAALNGDVESMKKLQDVCEKGGGQKADPEKTKFWKERISKESGGK
jgi:TPR repeat protein